MLKRIHSFIALAVVVVLAAWLLFGRRTTSETAVPTPKTEASRAAVELVGPTAQVEPTKREELAPPAPNIAPQPDPQLARVRGRCVAAESGAPLAGCTVVFEGWPGNEDKMERHGPVEWTDPAPVVTADDGRFEVAFVPPPPYQHHLDAEAPGRVPRTARWGAFQPGQTEDLGDIELAIGHTVEGRVVDESGTPVSDVYVALDNLPLPLRGDMAANDSRGAKSNENGDFRIEVPIPAGTWTIDVNSRGIKLVSPDSVTVAERSGAVPATVVVRTMPSISGVVVDEAGAGITDVYVDVEMHGSGRMAAAWTREGGTFTIHAVSDELAPARLTVRHTGVHEPLVEPTQPYAWGTKDIRIELRRARSFELVVVEEGSGVPVEDYAVECVLQDGGWNSNELRLGGRHPDGRVTVDGVRRGTNSVRVVPKDTQLSQHEPTVVEIGEEAIPEVRIELARSVMRAVHVVDAARRPVAGSKVELVALNDEAFDADSWVLGMRSGGSYSSEPNAFHQVVAEATTDAEGLARVAVPPTVRRLGLRVSSTAHPTAVVSDTTFPPGDDAFEVVVATGGRIAGTVRVSGYPTGEFELHLELDGASSNAEAVYAALDVDGAFESRSLRPGSYSLFLSLDHRERRENGSSGWKLRIEPALGVVAVVEGQTTRIALDASALAAGSVVGHVLLNGEPFSECRVFLVRDRARFGQFVPNPDGRFEASGLPPGTWSAELVVGDFKARDGDQISSDETFELAPGATVTRDFAFERRRITLRVLRPDGVTPFADAEIQVVILGRGEFDERRTDANGLLVLDPAPTGSVQVRAADFVSDPIELPVADDGRALDVVLRES
jgi:hypothetical protein